MSQEMPSSPTRSQSVQPVSRDLRLILGADRAIAHLLRIINIITAMRYLTYRHNGKIFVSLLS